MDDDPEESGHRGARAADVDVARSPSGGQAEGAAPTTAVRVEQAAERPGELALVEVAHDARALDEADLAVLLGHDDDDGIGLLGDAEGGAMARPEALGLDGRLGQRQERAGGEDRSRRG